MKSFIYGILELIKNQKNEKCSVVEEQMRIGIASVLYSKYPEVFNSLAFNPDRCQEIDDYYKNLVGIADGNEQKYACDENDGLYLIIILALEKIY